MKNLLRPCISDITPTLRLIVTVSVAFRWSFVPLTSLNLTGRLRRVLARKLAFVLFGR